MDSLRPDQPRITVKGELFGEALYKLRGVTEGTLGPTPGYVLVEAALGLEGPELIMRAGDGDACRSVTIEAERSAELREGLALVPFRRLAELAKPWVSRGSGPAPAETLTLDGGALAPVERPPTRKHRVQMGSLELRQLLDRAAYAISTDTTRVHLAALHLIGTPEGLRAEATDGYRLARSAPVRANCVGSFDIMLHRRAVEELRRDFSKLHGRSVSVLMGWDDGDDDLGVTILVAGSRIGSRRIEGSFLKSEHVIPTSHDGLVSFDRKNALLELRALLKRAGAGQHAIRFDTRGGLVAVSVESEGVKPLSVTLRGETQGNVPEAFGLRDLYLLDVLEACDDATVILKVSGPLDPVTVIDADGSVHVVMPVRVT